MPFSKVRASVFPSDRKQEGQVFIFDRNVILVEHEDLPPFFSEEAEFRASMSALNRGLTGSL